MSLADWSYYLSGWRPIVYHISHENLKLFSEQKLIGLKLTIAVEEMFYLQVLARLCYCLCQQNFPRITYKRYYTLIGFLK